MVDPKSLLNLAGAKPAPRDVSARGQSINEEAGLPDNWVPADRPPIIPASAPQAGDEGSSRYLTGSLPPGYQHDTSFVGTSYRTSNAPSLSLMPLGIQGNPATNAAIMSTARLTAIPSSPALPQPTLGDGLTHGRLPWPGDAGVVEIWDDFIGSVGGGFAGGISTVGIGQLGWVLLGAASTIGGTIGGTPPYLGQMSWSNSAIADQAGWLVLNSAGQYDSLFQQGYALSENAGSIHSFIFKLEVNHSTLVYDTTKKSMYVGLMGIDIGGISTPTSRPDVFIGIRFDTTPTISDAFLTFEVVANQTPTAPVRNNTQGVTMVTSVAPVSGVWHRLDIFCDAAGSVTLTLDGSTTNTLTTTIPTISFTTTVNSTASGTGAAQLSWSGSPINPWVSGSAITALGFTGTSAFLNDTNVLVYADDAVLVVNAAGTFANSDTVTLTGYPALTPVALFGNDSQAVPTTNTATFFIDYWSFVWNPNLGPNKPGTPDPTKPRYF